MRTHGWSGSAPATDEEAVARILDAAGKAIDAHGADISIADVARTLGVTRQTVYRYFPGTEALLVAAAVHAADDFQERLAAHLRGVTDPVAVITEAIATALEWLPKDKHIGLLITPDVTVAAIIAAVICAMPRMPGFHRIRHYGLFANGHRAEKLALCRKLLDAWARRRSRRCTALPMLRRPYEGDRHLRT